MYKAKVDAGNASKDIDTEIGKLDNEYKKLLSNINFYGITQQKYANKTKIETDIYLLNNKRKEILRDLDEYNYRINETMREAKDIKRSNALIPEHNRKKVQKYEQALMQVNRNRLNIQQQPYESDYDYYKRLKEVEASKYDPVLYRQYSANKTTKELKPKMTSLFNNESFIENVMKSINDEYKFIINNFFENIKRNLFVNMVLILI